LWRQFRASVNSAVKRLREKQMMELSIINYSPTDQSAVRRILEHIGWAEQYVAAAEQNAELFSQNPEMYGVYVAKVGDSVIGFIYVQFYEWNQLAQIQGLAVEPSYQRQGVASELVKMAEKFAREKHARGIYVDTPTLNRKGRSFYEAEGYSFGYEMPRYYEDNLDGVTYQKFFSEG
jgi:ribosomal protein S18 acetylase RimI-like enzyme